MPSLDDAVSLVVVDVEFSVAAGVVGADTFCVDDGIFEISVVLEFFINSEVPTGWYIIPKITPQTVAAIATSKNANSGMNIKHRLNLNPDVIFVLGNPTGGVGKLAEDGCLLLLLIG